MGPPREHGGMHAAIQALLASEEASMGPPREHGGMLLLGVEPVESNKCFNGAAA